MFRRAVVALSAIVGMRGAVALVARASVARARARAATRLASAAPRNLEALEAELAKHDDLYASIDAVVDKLERQLHDWKEKISDHKG